MEEQARKFLEYADRHYGEYKLKWKKYVTDSNLDFDEDVFSDTILKVYDYIIQNGIKDDSDEGLANYWFKSFVMNIKREKMYSRNQKRDFNVDASEELDTRDDGTEELMLKLRQQTYSDYAIIYILKEVESNFDSLTFYCFRLYFILPKMTYERLRSITNVKDCKRRVVQAKKWVKENIKKEEIMIKFNEWYDSN